MCAHFCFSLVCRQWTTIWLWKYISRHEPLPKLLQHLLKGENLTKSWFTRNRFVKSLRKVIQKFLGYLSGLFMSISLHRLDILLITCFFFKHFCEQMHRYFLVYILFHNKNLYATSLIDLMNLWHVSVSFLSFLYIWFIPDADFGPSRLWKIFLSLISFLLQGCCQFRIDDVPNGGWMPSWL